MLTKNQFNLTDEILEAAKLLKEEQDLICSSSEIASVIHNWLCDHLEDIEWNYQNSNSMQKQIFNLELKTERLATEELPA